MVASSKLALLPGSLGPDNMSCLSHSFTVVVGVSAFVDDDARWCPLSVIVAGVVVGLGARAGAGALLLQCLLRKGKQLTQGQPDLTQVQDLQRPLPLHRQHTGILYLCKQ